MRFHKTKDILQNFSGITLDFCEIAKYFVDFWFYLWYFQKMTAKFWVLLNRFEILKFKIWQWRKLKSQYRSCLNERIKRLKIKWNFMLSLWCYDVQQNGIRNNYTQHNSTLRHIE